MTPNLGALIFWIVIALSHSWLSWRTKRDRKTLTTNIHLPAHEEIGTVTIAAFDRIMKAEIVGFALAGLAATYEVWLILFA